MIEVRCGRTLTPLLALFLPLTLIARARQQCRLPSLRARE
jgi:hypothetical protein